MNKIIIFIIGLFLINLVTSATITTFNNSLTNENLTFTGNQNITRYLSIPEGYLVNFSNITLRGYNGNNFLNNKTIGTYSSVNNFNDGDWDTSGRDGLTSYKNYTINSSGIISMNLTAKYKIYENLITDDTRMKIYCYNLVSNDWTQILEQPTNTYGEIFINTTNVHNSCIGDNIGFKFNSTYASGSGWFPYYYETNISYIYDNITYPSLLINNQTLWSANNFTSTISLTNLSNSINNYLSTCTLISGNCLVPFTFHSDTAGILEYSNLEFELVEYINNGVSYSSQVGIGTPNVISANFSFGSNPTNVRLNYNGTIYTPSITTSGIYSILNSTATPNIFNVNTNITFYWTFDLNGVSFQTTSYTQLVTSLLIDNCSSYTYKLFNLSLLDEETKTSIFGDVQVNYQLLNTVDYGVINSILLNLVNVTNASICTDINVLGGNMVYSAEIRYVSEGYTAEFYNIQRADIGTSTQTIKLFDLNLSDSTEFKITYQDSNFDFIENAVIQLQRKYISEGIYETVEAPLTSSDGTTTLHIDLNTNKYRATVVKNGIVLDEFDNLVFKCQSELTGECEQKLLGEINPQNDNDINNILDFYYSEPVSTNESITLSFSIPSGLPSGVNIVMQQKDQFGNKTLCNQTISSSAGSLSCTYSETLGKSYVDMWVYKDNVSMSYKTYILEFDGGLDWLDNNYIFIFIMLLSLVGMALASPEWMIINGIVTFVIAGALYLARGLDFVAGLGIIIWLVIASIILISKLSKQEDR